MCPANWAILRKQLSHQTSSQSSCVGTSTMNQKDALSSVPSSKGASVPHLECRPAQSCAMTSLGSAACLPVSLCYRHPVSELLNNSPGDKGLSPRGTNHMCHTRALSLNRALNEQPRSSLVPLLAEAYLPCTAVLLREILQSNL